MSGQLVPSNSRRTPVVQPGQSVVQDPQRARWPAPNRPQQTDSPTEHGIPWRRYMDAVRRHRLLVVTLVAVGIAAGYTVSRFVKPQYEVHTSIWIPVADHAADNPAAVQSDRVLDPGGWADLLTSYAVLDQVVAQYGLVASPRDAVFQSAFENFRPGDKLVAGTYHLKVAPNGRTYTLTREKSAGVPTAAPETGTLGDSIGRSFGFRWAPAASQIVRDGKEVVFGVSTIRQASTALRKRMTVQLSDSSFIIAKLVGTQPARDAAVLNALGRTLVATATDLKRHNNTEVLQSLQSQLADAASGLKSAENALASFQTSAITEPSEASITDAMRDPTAQQYFSSRSATDSLRADRDALTQLLNASKGRAIDVGALLSIPSARNAPELAAAVAELNKADSSYQALRRQFTPAYKPVQDVQAEIDRLKTAEIPRIAASILSRLGTQQTQYATRAFKAANELRDIPGRTLEEARLRRDVQNRESLYNTLKARVDGSNMAQQTSVAEASVLDSAVAPMLPVGNTRTYLLGISVLFAFAIGIGAAIVLDLVDPKLRYPEQVSDLGLSLLTAVPHLQADSEIDHSLEDAAQAVESFRALRLALRHQQPGSGPVQLTVTSPGAGEGKSLLAANLALSFAEAGYRTLLIDGDIRRGRQHETFGAAMEPGLTDFLAGSAQPAEIARRSTHPNLLVIPSGSRLGSGPELLMSDALPRLLDAVRPLFNAIIVDSPPLGAGADPLVLGSATGNVMVVLRAGQTDRRMARSRLSLLTKTPVRVLGAVLNDIGHKGVYREYSYIEGYYVPVAHEAANAHGGAAEVLPVPLHARAEGAD